MNSKKMRVRITHSGRTEIKVEGGQGDDCVTFTHSLEQALGQVQHREFTADYDTPQIVMQQTATETINSYAL